MPFVHISAAPSRDLYDSLRSKVDMAGFRGDGLLLHAASDLPSGEVRIVDVYETAEAMQRADARMRALFADAGLEPMVAARPQPEVSETFELVR